LVVRPRRSAEHSSANAENADTGADGGLQSAFLRHTVQETDRHATAGGNASAYPAADRCYSRSHTKSNDATNANAQPRDISADADARSRGFFCEPRPCRSGSVRFRRNDRFFCVDLASLPQLIATASC
jgi:hypothetical protein